MVVEPSEINEPPTGKNKKWDKIKRELLFWTSILANLITIIFFLIKLFKNGM